MSPSKILADLQVRFVSRVCEPANVLKCVSAKKRWRIKTLWKTNDECQRSAHYGTVAPLAHNDYGLAMAGHLKNVCP